MNNSLFEQQATDGRGLKMRIKRKNVTTPQKSAPSETKDPHGSTRSTSVCDESAPSPSITIIDYQDQPKVSHGSNSSASPDHGSTVTPSGHKKPSRHGKTRNLRDCNSTEDKKGPARPVKEEIKTNSGRQKHHKASGSTASLEPWEKEHLPPNPDKQTNQHWGADLYDRSSRDSTDPYEFVVNKVEGGTTSTVTLTAGQGVSKKKFKAVDKHDSTSGMITGTPNRVSTPSNKTTITNLPPKNSQNSSTEVVQQSSQQCTRALQCDVPVASCDANVMTDMDLLGPCEPGTSVVLEGIVWTESNNGILVVNVTWRGKTYVGTLMDATRHHWAPPRYRDDSPVMDLDWKTPKYRNGRNANNANNNDSSSAGEGRKLRKCRRNNNNNSSNNNNNSTINSLRSQSTRQSPVFNNDTNTSGGGSSRRRSRIGADSNQQIIRDDSPIPSKKTKDARAECESSTQMWECSEGNCGKKFKQVTALKYHQTHVHRKLPTVVVSGNVVEELKESSPSIALEAQAVNKKSKKSSRNGTPDLKSESVSPVAEICANAFSAVPAGAKTDSQNLSELSKLTPKSMTPELPESCSSPSASFANDATEAVPRPGKRKFADISAEDNDVKPDITKIASGSSTETSSVHSSSTESRADFVSSPVTQDEDCKPVNFASAEMPRSPATGMTSRHHTPSSQDAPLNCKTSFESVPENVVKTEPTTTPVKTQQREVKQEQNVVKTSAESDRAQGGYGAKDSPWRDTRVPPLNAQMAAPLPYPPSMFGFGIDPIYHMQLMASPEHRSQIDRWLAEQHYRQMYGRFDAERHSLQEAKPVDMTLKSSASSSSQEQLKSQKKADAQTAKRPVPASNQNPVCPDKKVHSNKKTPQPTPPATPQSDEKKKLLNFKSERPESRQQASSPGQMLRGTPRSGIKEADLAMFSQGYPYAHPLAKLPFELQPNMHGSPFLDPAAAQVGLPRANPHYLDRAGGIPESKLDKEQAKIPSGKRSVEAPDDLHKDTSSSSKDKSASLQSTAGGHNSLLTLRHLHTHHHTHVLGPAYSLYSSYNGLVPPPQLVSPVVPVLPPAFIPK